MLLQHGVHCYICLGLVICGVLKLPVGNFAQGTGPLFPCESLQLACNISCM